MDMITLNSLLSKPWAASAKNIELLHRYMESSNYMIPKVELPYRVDKKRHLAIIYINGMLSKESIFSPGMNDIIGAIFEAEKDQTVTKVIFSIDCEGATVDGIIKLGNTIKSMKKDNIALIDGCALSGGYWIASYAKKVVAINETCMLGAIGISTHFQSFAAYNAKKGIRDHKINSDYSPHKNLPLLKALEGDYKSVKKEMLNPLAEIFIAEVKKNRPLAVQHKDNWSTGKSFLAPEALTYKLIDSIGHDCLL